MLVVDDDPLMCRLVEVLLQSQGHSAVTVDSYEAAVTQIQRQMPDLVLLDVQLPRIDGFTAMRQLKRQYENLPVIMLTARADMQDRLMGLDTGADDYVVKPFEPAELLARVKAVLRRSQRNIAASMEMVTEENGLRLDVRSTTVTLPDGQVVLLTPTETRVLHRLMSRSNHIVSREELINFAIGSGADNTTNQIDVYVGRIRRKIGDDPNNPGYIVTVRGSGYKFLSPTQSSAILESGPGGNSRR